MRKLIVVFVLIVGFAHIGKAVACSCEPQTGPVSAQVAKAVSEATAVFSSEVIEAEDVMAGVEHYQAAKLRVLKSWKGPHAVGSVVRTATQTVCCLCGIRVAVKETLLVYVYGNQPYQLSDCSRTGKLSSAADEVRILDGMSRDQASQRKPESPRR